MASKAATTAAVDFTRIYSSLGLGKETVASLQAFRKRHADAQRIAGQLSAQPTTVDLAHYRSVLKNKAVVDEVEKVLRDFKPVTYDVSTHIKAIETFETKAVGALVSPPSTHYLMVFRYFSPSLWILCWCFSIGLRVSRVQVAKAKETEAQIDVELKDLQATLANIEEARPFEDLTVEEVGQAHPRILEAVETMVQKGKWTVPGYKEKFGDLSLM
ncbi:mitochondrial ATP synthase [Gloeopeniophorella convolvens]|nr:mitochondrial ATP synthase [Gloeopeniophorella convolvens]